MLCDRVEVAAGLNTASQSAGRGTHTERSSMPFPNECEHAQDACCMSRSMRQRFAAVAATGSAIDIWQM
jgi:hypothetical protein